MYIVIVGGGKVGYHLTRALLNAKHEVFVIEMDAERVDDLVGRFGNMAIRGDGSEPNTLAAAGLVRADIFIATTSFDDANLVACQLAKHQFGVDRTIALMNNPENERLFDTLGVDFTVSSTEILLAAIEEDLPANSNVRILPIHGNRDVVGVEIPPGALVAGNSLGLVDLPQGTTLVAVIGRNGEMKLLEADTVFEIHDEVLGLTAADQAEAFMEVFTSEG